MFVRDFLLGLQFLPSYNRGMGNAPQQKPRPFQFHLSTLLAAVTGACLAFALIGNFGVRGTEERVLAALLIVSPFVPLVEFYYWWRNNMQD